MLLFAGYILYDTSRILRSGAVATGDAVERCAVALPRRDRTCSSRSCAFSRLSAATADSWSSPRAASRARSWSRRACLRSRRAAWADAPSAPDAGPPAAAPSGVAVLARPGAEDAAWALAKEVYAARRCARPRSTSRARACSWGTPLQRRSAGVKDLADERAGVHGDDGASRALLRTIASQLNVRALVVVEAAHEGAPSPSARVFVSETGTFDAARYDAGPSPRDACSRPDRRRRRPSPRRRNIGWRDDLPPRCRRASPPAAARALVRDGRIARPRLRNRTGPSPRPRRSPPRRSHPRPRRRPSRTPSTRRRGSGARWAPRRSAASPFTSRRGTTRPTRSILSFRSQVTRSPHRSAVCAVGSRSRVGPARGARGAGIAAGRRLEPDDRR